MGSGGIAAPRAMRCRRIPCVAPSASHSSTTLMHILRMLMAVGITGLAIIVGEDQDSRFEGQQIHQRMQLRPFYTKLFPDLRAAQRLGREREDKMSVHLWVRVDRVGECRVVVVVLLSSRCRLESAALAFRLSDP